MQLPLALLLALLTSVHAFRLQTRPTAGLKSQGVHLKAPLARPSTRLLAAGDSEGSSFLPATKENIESVAGVTGGVVGLIFFGPVVGLGLAAVSLYVSKKDNDGGEALRGVGRAVLDAVNYLTKLNGKFDITGKVVGKVSEVVDSSESEAVVKVKEVFGKVSEVNSQYGLLDKGKEAIGAAAKLSESALEQAEVLNEKYDFIQLAKNAAAQASEKAKELADKAKN
jgi:hypothetical protein